MNNTAGELPKCPYCGAWPHQHIGQCPAVRKIEYYPNGTIKSVEKIVATPNKQGETT